MAAVETTLPTWAVVECTADGEPITGGTVAEILAELEDAGASVVLFEVPSIAQGVEQLRRVKLVETLQAVPGVLVAGGEESVRGFPDSSSVPDQWARNALDLDAAGARLIGGGAGTTEAHTAALAQELGELHPSLPM